MYIYTYIYIYIYMYRTFPIQQVKGLAHCSIEGLKADFKVQ